MDQQRKTLTITIERPPDEVLAFIAEPSNLPRWARHVCSSIEPSGRAWVAWTPVGPVPLRFEKRENALDLRFTYWPGQELSIPISVRPVRNGTATDVVMEFVKPPLMSQQEFPEDVALIERELPMLKALLEQPGASTAPGT